MAKADRNGRRKGRDSVGTKPLALGYYFVVTDTKETEENYLDGLKASLPESLRDQIVIKVAHAKTEDLVETCLREAAVAPQYRRMWIVFDRDRVKDFDRIIEKAERNGVSVGWSNPCLEIWFDAYFGKMPPCSESTACCRGFSDTFLSKTGREYKKSDEQIYELLNRYGDESKAIERAKYRLASYVDSGVRKPSKMCPCTTLHRLVEEIKGKAQ
jgi:hypothetical protein